MKDLKCGKRECTHNRAYSCVAKQIRVERNADCGSFSPSEQKRQMAFEAGEDFASRDYSVDTLVACGADCVFNRNSRCYANGITVMADHGHEAACLTYIKS